jgi:hypothetical protein
MGDETFVAVRAGVARISHESERHKHKARGMKLYAYTANAEKRSDCGWSVSPEGWTSVEILALSSGYKPLQGNMPDDCPQTHAHQGFFPF